MRAYVQIFTRLLGGIFEWKDSRYGRLHLAIETYHILPRAISTLLERSQVRCPL